MHSDLFPFIALLAALGLLAGVVAAMRADHMFIRRRLAAEAACLKLWAHGLADASFDGLVIHRQGVILLMNRALVRMLAVREREFLGQNFATLAREEDVAALRAELEAPGPDVGRYRLKRANKSEIMVELSSQSIEFEGQPATVTALRDITQSLADAEKIARLTHHDPLTGLANRGMFERILEREVAAQGRSKPVALLLADIHRFKALNQQFGRKAGDALLQQLGQRLGALLAGTDTLARLSGDKFAMLLGADGPPHRGLSLGGQILAACAEPFIIDGRLVNLNLNIGMALFPDHAADAESLLRAAELALGQAQLQFQTKGEAPGGALYMFRHEDVNLPRLRQEGVTLPRARAEDLSALRSLPAAAPANLGDDLRGALVRGEFRLLYQPAFNLADLSLLGFSASARWQHPAQGLLRPEQFMGIAEAAGLALELGSQLIERACAEAALAGGRIAVSLSPSQFNDPQLPARLTAILRKTGLAAEALEVEITEAMLAEHADHGAALLQALHQSGIGIALDDFGAGSAPLGALCHLPLSRLKIGPRFISKLGRERNAEAMVSATLSLAANLRLAVTAQGVETEAQLDSLRRQGCHAAQGKLLGEAASRPLARPPVLSVASA